MKKELNKNNKVELSCKKEQRDNILEEQINESSFIIQDLRETISFLETVKNDKNYLKEKKLINRIIEKYNSIIEEEFIKISETIEKMEKIEKS